MKKIFYTIVTSLVLSTSATFLSSCDSTKSYAEYVNDENRYIREWIDYNDFEIAGRFDEEQIENMATAILEDSVCPSEFIELGKWYQISEGDFIRLCFRINDWGKDYPDMKSKKKFLEDENVLVRYSDLHCLTEYNYDDVSSNIIGDNLDPNSYLICYSWRRNYYSNNYYSYYYGSSSSYECSSGGMAFPIRFLWEGGDASVIVPFNLAPSNMAAYYYTLYYGSIRYTKPNFLPQ